jgi:anti-sigma factor RsiW
MHSPHPGDDDLQRYADGELTANDAALIAHIEGCAECQSEVERVRRVTAALALTSKAPPARGLPLRARRSSWKDAAVPIALLAAAVIVLFILSRAERPAGPGTPPVVVIDTPSPNVAFAPPVGAGSVLAERTLLAWSAIGSARVDSLAGIVRRDSAATVVLGFDPAEPGSTALADSAQARLRAAGIAASRIRIAPPVDGAPGVKITVVRTRSRN